MSLPEDFATHRIHRKRHLFQMCSSGLPVRRVSEGRNPTSGCGQTHDADLRPNEPAFLQGVEAMVRLSMEQA